MSERAPEISFKSRSRRSIFFLSLTKKRKFFLINLRLFDVKCPDVRSQCVPHMHTYIANTRDRCSIYAMTKTSFRFRGCSENLARVSRLPSSRRRGLDLNAMILMTRRIKKDPILPRFKKTPQESTRNFESVGDNPSDRLSIRLCRETDCIVLPIIFAYF